MAFKALGDWHTWCKTGSYFAIIHNSRTDCFSETERNFLMKIQAWNNAKSFSVLPTVFDTSSFELQTDNVGNILSNVSQTLSVMMKPKTCFFKQPFKQASIKVVFQVASTDLTPLLHVSNVDVSFESARCLSLHTLEKNRISVFSSSCLHLSRCPSAITSWASPSPTSYASVCLP